MATSQEAIPSSEEPRAAYAALVRAAAAGDAVALERLLTRAQEVAYRFSLLVCGHPEDAEDVMQDALLRTYQHVNQIADPEAFRTWLYSTVRNACLMNRRRRVGEPSHLVSVEQGMPAADGSSPPIDIVDKTRPVDEQLIADAIDVRVRDALQALPPASRAIIVMRDMEGLSTREVAEILQISETNVKTRLYRARTLLRRELKGE